MNGQNSFFFRRSPVRKHGVLHEVILNSKYPTERGDENEWHTGDEMKRDARIHGLMDTI